MYKYFVFFSVLLNRYGMGNNKAYNDIMADVGTDGNIEVLCSHCGKPHGIKVLVGDMSKIILPSTQYCPHCGTLVRYTFDEKGYLTVAVEEEF